MAGEPRRPAPEELSQMLIGAIVDFYREDAALLALDANERTITHKLAEHLQRRIPDWHVDCEYNRHGNDPKRLQTPLDRTEVGTDSVEAVTVFPDIIIHRRATDSNLAVVEVKKHNGRQNTWDQEKVEAFARSPAYRYREGFLLKLGHGGRPELEAYRGATGNWVSLSEDLLAALAEHGHAE